MRPILMLSLAALLSACTLLNPSTSPDAAAPAFLAALDELAANGRTAPLEEFVSAHPDHPYAKTALALAEAARQQARRMDECRTGQKRQDDLVKANQRQEAELKQLRSDLERLSRLLVEAEQRAP